MVDVGKREDQLLDKISQLTRNRNWALGLIREFRLADPGLSPVLNEIELALQSTADVSPRITNQVKGTEGNQWLTAN